MVQDESTTDELLTRLKEGQQALGDLIEPVLRERPTMEHVLLVLFLTTGIYMYLGAREFSDAAAEFPQLMAGATAILSFLILVRNYLNVVTPVMAVGLGAYAVYTGGTTFLADDGGIVRIIIGAGLLVAAIGFRRQLVDGAESFIAEPMQVLGEEDLIGDDEEDEEPAEEEAEEDSGAMYVYEIDDPKGPVVMGLLCVGYMALTFAIGMLYATPVFVIAWALWVRMDVGKAAALTGLGLGCSYLFYEFIQSDISEGWLTDWRPTPPDELLELLPLAIDPAARAVTELSTLGVMPL